MGVIFGWLPAEFVPCTDGHVTVVTRQLGCALFAGVFIAMLSHIRSRKDAATGQHPARRQMPECAKSLRTVDP